MKKLILIAFMMGTAITFSASADTVLVSNTCDSATGWTIAGGTSLAVTNNFGGTGNTSPALKLSGSGNNKYVEFSLGQDITLGNDESIALEVDYRFTTTPPDADNSMFFGFVNNSSQITGDPHAGAFLNLGTGGPLGNNSKFSQTDDVNEGKFATLDSGLTSHNLVLTVTRQADGLIRFDLTVDGTVIDVSKTGNTVMTSPTFDALRLGGTSLGTSVADILYDNVVVSTTASLTEAPALELDAGTQSFQIAPDTTKTLSLVIRNTGFDATNITAALSTTSTWFTVNTAPIATAALAGSGGEMTNTFSVSAASSTPLGDYPDILSLEMVAYGSDGIAVTSTAPVSLTAQYNLPELTLDAESQSFEIDQGATQNLPLRISNTGYDATNITVTVSEDSPWFTVNTSPVSTDSLAGSGGEMTNTFSVSADGSTPAGGYPDVLSLEMVSENLDGIAVTSTAPVSLTVVSTNITGTILLSDTFSGGTVEDWAPDAEGGISTAVTNDNSGIGGGNALLITSESSNRRVTTPLSESVTLSLTNSIKLDLDYRFLNGPSNVNQSLEFQFADSISGNYAGFVMNPATNAGQTLIFGRDGDNNEGKKNSFDHGTAVQSMNLTVTHVVDGSNTELQFDVSWDGNPAGPYTAGGTSTITDPTHSFTFDSLSVGVMGGTTTDGLLLDNILVTTTQGDGEPPQPTVTKIGNIGLNIPAGGSDFVISWASTNGAPYAVESTTNLVTGEWVPAITNIIGNGGTLSVTGSLTEAQRFYQVIAE